MGPVSVAGKLVRSPFKGPLAIEPVNDLNSGPGPPAHALMPAEWRKGPRQTACIPSHHNMQPAAMAMVTHTCTKKESSQAGGTVGVVIC